MQFKYKGFSWDMTPAELEAAYGYCQHLHNIQDCKYALDGLKEEIIDRYGMTLDEAKLYTEEITDEYESWANSGTSARDTWKKAINNVLSVKMRHRQMRVVDIRVKVSFEAHKKVEISEEDYKKLSYGDKTAIIKEVNDLENHAVSDHLGESSDYAIFDGQDDTKAIIDWGDDDY